MRFGTVPSWFSTRKLERPPSTTFPLEISATSTSMLAVGLLETANTGRATPACGATETSKVVVTGEGGVGGLGGLLRPAVKEANPPGGWLPIVSRKLFSTLVEFCTKTTKAR